MLWTVESNLLEQPKNWYLWKCTKTTWKISQSNPMLKTWNGGKAVFTQSHSKSISCILLNRRAWLNFVPKIRISWYLIVRQGIHVFYSYSTEVRGFPMLQSKNSWTISSGSKLASWTYTFSCDYLGKVILILYH